MSSLVTMSAEEISRLLDEYGIKHGPVVDSTRRLYEKKLNEAMSQAKRAKPPSDKTFYREEEDEVTYVYRSPVRAEKTTDSYAYVRSRPHQPEGQFEKKSYTYKNIDYNSASVKSAQETQTPPKSSRFIPLWVQIVFFLVVAIFFYVVFATMESNDSFPGISQE